MKVLSVLASFAAALSVSHAAAPPSHNPAGNYKLAWIDGMRWATVVNIADFPGANWNARLGAAQDAVAAKGGGVVYIPPGTYEFSDSIALKDGVVLRGADPEGVTDARQEGYSLSTKLEFPKFVPRLEGEGTPHDSAFKMVYLEHPESDSNCGLVNLAFNRAHIYFGSATNHQCGKNRLVLGCTFRNAADIDRNIPNLKDGQQAWQRFPKWHQAAVGVYATENILIANNRLPESGEDNFLMKEYLLKDRKGKMSTYEDGILFDYDFRPGIIANQHCVGGGGGAMPVGTPDIYPWGFSKGIVIRSNYIFSTGRTAIAFCGDGVICSFNVIRFKKGVVRPSHTGQSLSSGSSTSDNRAVEMRGWRWTVEGNDYEVYRSLCSDKKFYINDGEGLMHEGHCNSAVLDSKLIGNKGNAYLSIFHTGGIDGLVVEDNDIRPDPKVASSIAAIYVVADRNKTPFPCRNVRIEKNITGGTGIQIAGTPGENNLIANNRSVSEKGKILNRANAGEKNNSGYLEASTAGTPGNLMSDGSFENGAGGWNGKLAGVGKSWEVICGGPHPEIYALDSKVKHSGKYSQRFGCQNFNGRFTPDGAYCFHLENGQEVKHPVTGLKLGNQALAQATKIGAIRPGKTYALSAWVKIDGLTASWEWFRLGIYWLDGQGKFISESRESNADQGNIGTHDWKKIKLTAAAPANAVQAKVYLHHHFEHGTVWFDDVELIEERALGTAG